MIGNWGGWARFTIARLLGRICAQCIAIGQFVDIGILGVDTFPLALDAGSVLDG